MGNFFVTIDNKPHYRRAILGFGDCYVPAKPIDAAMHFCRTYDCVTSPILEELINNFKFVFNGKELKLFMMINSDERLCVGFLFPNKPNDNLTKFQIQWFEFGLHTSLSSFIDAVVEKGVLVYMAT